MVNKEGMFSCAMDEMKQRYLITSHVVRDGYFRHGGQEVLSACSRNGKDKL